MHPQKLTSVFIYLFYVHWCFACMYVCVKVSDLGVIDSCELPCRCQELNLSPLEEQPVLLTLAPV